jgi:uncharacterized protein
MQKYIRNITFHSCNRSHVSLHILDFLRFFRKILDMNVKTLSNSLVDFSFSNVRSFRDDATISLEATRMAEPGVAAAVPWRKDGATLAILPSAGIFGGNASGKTNVLRAMTDMRKLVLGSFRNGSQSTSLRRRPFRLDPTSVALPSQFAITLILNGVRWEYGFDITDTEVVTEYAYHYPKGRQSLVLQRDRESFHFGSSMKPTGKTLEKIARHNSLLLSVAGAAANNDLSALFHWFSINARMAEANSRAIRAARTIELVESSQRNRVLALIRAADLGVTEIRREDSDPERAERMKQAIQVLNGTDENNFAHGEPFGIEDFVRLTHSGPEGSAELEPDEESLGTLVWISLIGPVLDALDNGSVLLADELDASLHPRLCEHLIRMFQNSITNPLGAQLLFTAHNPIFLGDSADRPLGRDQIWITEKSNDGSSRLYSLAEFSPRQDEALGRRYAQGRYGGLPVIDPSGFLRAAVQIDELVPT